MWYREKDQVVFVSSVGKAELDFVEATALLVVSRMASLVNRAGMGEESCMTSSRLRMVYLGMNMGSSRLCLDFFVAVCHC